MHGKLSLVGMLADPVGVIAASDKNYENHRAFYRKTALKD